MILSKNNYNSLINMKNKRYNENRSKKKIEVDPADDILEEEKVQPIKKNNKFIEYYNKLKSVAVDSDDSETKRKEELKLKMQATLTPF